MYLISIKFSPTLLAACKNKMCKELKAEQQHALQHGAV